MRVVREDELKPDVDAACATAAMSSTTPILMICFISVMKDRHFSV